MPLVIRFTAADSELERQRQCDKRMLASLLLNSCEALDALPPARARGKYLNQRHSQLSPIPPYGLSSAYG